jgi:multidrug efflux pump subunit AcrB
LAKFEQAAKLTTGELDTPTSVTGVFSMLGEGPQPGGPVPLPPEKGGYLVTVQVELVASADRDFTAASYAKQWEENLPPIAGIDTMNFSSVTGPGGGPAVTVRLSHSEAAVLQNTADDLIGVLRTFPSLTSIKNSNSNAKPQLNFKLRDVAASVGATSGAVARQIRDGFYGVEALREQRERNELKVRVQMPREEREREFAIEQFRVRTAAGTWVPLHSIASVERNAANTVIRREASVRTIEVSAELTPEARTAQDVLSYLEADYLPQLMAANPGLNAEFSGEQREQSETNASLARSYILAMFVMYALLAISFRSYLQPLVVMTAIPMGFVGAVFGHLAMGYSLSIISMFGIVALSGVVINDSLVLIDSTNQYRRAGATAYDAIMRGGMRRLRPILLTSLTTFFGLAPMIAETSMQAKFLIPMAISLGFGVLFATIIILVMVPAVYLIVDDLTSLLNRLFLSSQDEVTLEASPQPTP